MTKPQTPIDTRTRPHLLALGHLLGAALLVLTACGGGGGGGGSGGPPPPPAPIVTGNGFAPTTGPGDTNSYFPTGAQDQWLFDFTTDDPKALAQAGTVTIAVTGTKTIQGVSATVYTRADPTSSSGGYDEYFAVGNGGVTALGNTDPGDLISPLIIPYVELLFPVSLGQVSQVVGENLPFGTDANHNPITLNLTQTITNSAMETVDVPAGTFTNALKQVTTINATAQDGMQSVPITGTDSAWYAAGAGQVKDQSTATGGGTTINTAAQLRSYSINGKLRGIAPSPSPGFLVSATGCSGSSHPVPAVSSDGTNFLTVLYACSAPSNTVSNWIGVLDGPDGSMLKTFNITAPAVSSGTQQYLHAVSGFDGTHYLVVYEDASAGTSTAPLESIVLGIDGSVVAGPTMVATAFLADTSVPTEREALAFDGSHFLLIYTEGGGPPGTTPEVSGIFITPGTGQTAGSAFVISQGQGAGHDSPAIAFDGTNYLVVWVDEATAPIGLHAMRVSQAGTLVDAGPFTLVDLSTAVLQEACCDLEPTLSFDGTNYLVAYRDPRGVAPPGGGNFASISAARVSTAGLLLDGTATSPGIVVAASKTIPRGRVRSTFMNGAYWLVWETNSPQQLNATRVSTAGVAASAWTDGFVLVPAAYITELPAIAESSAGPLVVWLQRQLNPAYLSELIWLRIYPTGP
jgi:hypothetical protein